MSNSDNVVRLPRIASTHTLVVEVDDMGSYSYVIPDNMKRAVVRYDRQQKREMAQSGSGRKAQIADLDTQEQMRDALLSPAYEGPVGTPKAANDYRSNLDDTLRYAYECTDVCCWPITPPMPTRQEVEFSVDLAEAREVRLSTCAFGCKVYRTQDGREYILHSSVYGHNTASIEPLVVKVQPVVSRKRPIDRKGEEILRLRAERAVHGTTGDSDLEDVRRERKMRSFGFGGRYGVLLEG